MAITAISGTLGTLTYTGHNVRTTRWTLTTQQDANDTTGMGASGNWRTNLAGLKGWKFSFSGYVLAHAATTTPAVGFSATNDSPTADAGGIAVTLGADTGCTYTGNAFPTSFVLGTDVNGVGIVTGEAIGNGTLTEAWATT